MSNPELVKWVKEQRKKGFNSQKIFNFLTKYNYNSKEILEAMKEAEQQVPKKKSGGKLLAILLVLILIGGLGYGAYFLLSNSGDILAKDSNKKNSKKTQDSGPAMETERLFKGGQAQGVVSGSSMIPFKWGYKGTEGNKQVIVIKGPCEKRLLINEGEKKEFECDGSYIAKLVNVQENKGIQSNFATVEFYKIKGEKKTAAEQSSPELKQCDTMQCFIQASKDCTPARFTFTGEANMGGMLTKSTTLMEIRGMENDKCKYYDELKDITVVLDEKTKEEMLAQGKTEEEIRKQEEKTDAQAKKTIGMTTKCKFRQSELTSLLKKWQSGNYSMEDTQNQKCETALPEGYSP